MTWLMLVLTLEGGLVTGGVGVTNSNMFLRASYLEPEMSTYIEIGIEVSAWDILFVGGGVENFQVPKSLIVWQPHRAIYNIYGGVRFKGFEVGIAHYCDHPVKSSNALNSYVVGAQTKIYGKYTGVIGGNK